MKTLLKGCDGNLYGSTFEGGVLTDGRPAGAGQFDRVRFGPTAGNRFGLEEHQPVIEPRSCASLHVRSRLRSLWVKKVALTEPKKSPQREIRMQQQRN